MGRYYNGDIEGKFWVALQPSDADHFGGERSEPNYIEYYFDERHNEEIEKGIKECEDTLGEYKEKLDKFFANSELGYNDEMIMKEFEISKERVRELLEQYARLGLGIKIRDCVKETGQCSFEAEL